LTKTQVGHEAEVRTCEQSSLLCDGRLWHEAVLRQFGLKDKQTNISIARYEVVLRFVIFSQEPGIDSECTCRFLDHDVIAWKCSFKYSIA